MTALERIELRLDRLEALIRAALPPTGLGGVSSTLSQEDQEKAQKAADAYIERRVHELHGVDSPEIAD